MDPRSGGRGVCGGRGRLPWLVSASVALDALETERQQLAALQLGGDPGAGRLEVARAEAAPLQVALLGDGRGQVDAVLETGETAVGGIGGDGKAARAAENGGRCDVIEHVHTAVCRHV